MTQVIGVSDLPKCIKYNDKLKEKEHTINIEQQIEGKMIDNGINKKRRDEKESRVSKNDSNTNSNSINNNAHEKKNNYRI